MEITGIHLKAQIRGICKTGDDSSALRISNQLKIIADFPSPPAMLFSYHFLSGTFQTYERETLIGLMPLHTEINAKLNAASMRLMSL